MIKSVTVTNYLNESLKMDLFKPEKSGLLISNITGIGAPGADVNITNYAITDGGFFTSARASTRTITIVVYPLLGDKRSIETARQLTYRYFPIKHKCKLTFETDNHTLEIEGYVRQNDPEIFSKLENITIVVECPNPWFYLAGNPDSVIFNGVEPMFEFPFENESPTEPTLIMGDIVVSQARQIDYPGEIDTGFITKINILGPGVSGITLRKQDKDEFVAINTDKIEDITEEPLKRGDTIILSTVPGDRYLHLKRGSDLYNIINCLDLDSTWIKLTPGVNVFYYTADAGDMNLEFKIEFKPIYQGV